MSNTDKYVKGFIKNRYKDGIPINPDLPDEVQVVVETFIKQAIIVDEYGLDYLPNEYYINLIEVLSKYPEHWALRDELIRMAGEDMGVDVPQ